MDCKSFPLPGGAAIVCGRFRRKCSVCGRRAPFLCDWRLKGRKAGKTCDRPLCERCARVPVLGGEPVPDRHLCPAHDALWAKHPANVSAAPSAAAPASAARAGVPRHD